VDTFRGGFAGKTANFNNILDMLLMLISGALLDDGTVLLEEGLETGTKVKILFSCLGVIG
jgi:hypothetical protein